ncbi:hypothetical protein D3C72_1230540 [compost metagenome]
MAFELEEAAECLAPAPMAARKEAAAPTPIPRRWMRVEVVSGLELNIADDFRFSHSPDERQALLDLIAQQLDAATQAP